MTIDDIKPIPKYIIKLIEKKDNKVYSEPNGTTRFYAYISRFKKEIIKITVAVKHYKGKRYYKQVAIHGLNAKNCFARDMLVYYIGGYHVGWFSEGIQKYEKWYEDGKWYLNSDKKFDPYAPIVNRNYILKFPEFKYSAVTEYKCVDIFKYLRLYKQYPQAELLVKFGLSDFATSKQILRATAQDKSFRKWLINNRAEIASSNYYVHTLLLAYKTGKPLKETQDFELFKKHLTTDSSYTQLRIIFKNDMERFFHYIKKNDTELRSYKDYYDACVYLKLNMGEDKNLLPHNFKRWHDERIEQYRTLWYAELEKQRKEQLIKEEKERAKKVSQFKAISEKYSPLTGCTQNGLIIVIASSPADLVKEGQALNHCVGGITYTNRMADGESLIFFIRNAATPDIPFVTLEYSVQKKAVLQCYAYGNKKPNDTVMNFVNNIWLPYANKQLAKIKRTKIKAA